MLDYCDDRDECHVSLKPVARLFRADPGCIAENPVRIRMWSERPTRLAAASHQQQTPTHCPQPRPFWRLSPKLLQNHQICFELIAYIYACNPRVLSSLVSSPGLDFFPVDQSFNRALSAWALSKVKVLRLSFVVVFRWEWGREEPPSRWLATSPPRRYQRQLFQTFWSPTSKWSILSYWNWNPTDFFII